MTRLLLNDGTSNRVRGFVAAALLLGLSATLPTSAGAEENADMKKTLLTQMVSAYGGEETIAKTATLNLKAFSRQFQQENDGWITISLQHPRKLRLDMAYVRTPGTRIMNGDKIWAKTGKAAMTEADRPTAAGTLFWYRLADIPHLLLKEGDRMTYREAEMADGKKCDALVYAEEDAREVILCADESTRLVTKAATTIPAGDKTMEISVELSDFRDIDGVKVPFRMVLSNGTTKISQIVVSRAAYNESIESSTFKP